ncbi:hypothetical protein jhhlp_003517 [Lomentospora prolificans]|uniref:Ribosomal RNA-processing protein 8 n=1 Tax=Lomentospora prolificans TaxID=41688 RepID=A0A2N3N915_9PEZI|nr:hypothetical protein jhhlp_003517 [Lomentospora prolificans]
MFAVKGWSVSADALKAEQHPSGKNGPSKSKSKKRKRTGGDVTTDNVVSMYEKVIEGKNPNQKKGGEKAAKKQKRGSKGEDGEARKQWDSKKATQAGKPQEDTDVAEEAESRPEPDAESVEKAVKQTKQDRKDKKDKKDKKKGKEDKHQRETNTQPQTKEPASLPEAPKPPPSLAQPAPAKLTPLQAAMRAKLIPARFRHLNETLYTRPSDEAFKLFQDSPEMFEEYHAGFRQQVNVWPENPIDGYIRDVRARAAVSQPRERRDGPRSRKPAPPPPQQAQGGVAPLPRTKGICTIADLGCGDARLATVLQDDKESLNVNVLSFDLQSPSPLVTKADIANLPLEDGSVNVAIFCLALMGTNWLDFIEEAYRILHWKGELWIAEIKSRFGRVSNRSGNNPVAHSVGNRKKAAAAKNMPAAADFTQDLAVEVDGQDDTRNETDVSAFVDALKKRGFLLKGENHEAIDMSNRMFVKMHFIKAASPSKGEDAEKEGGSSGGSGGGRGDGGFRKGNKGWPPVVEKVDESKILKPCVYKLR